MRRRLAAVLALALAGCGAGSGDGGAAATREGHHPLALTIAGSNGAHRFSVEQAKSEAEQQQGMMYRPPLGADEGMLFWPYPPTGGPKTANFWMKNTPSPLDIVFIRPDRTIARIAENTVPFSETLVPSGEPVDAVLELRGGRALELGIDEGDKVSWDQP